MMKFLIVGFVSLAITGSTFSALPVKVNPCEVFGRMYITDDMREADFKVFVDDSEVYADLVVFKEDNTLMSDKEGVWFETSNIGFANYVIYYEKEEAYADFSVYFTEVPAFAGCN